MIGIMTIAEGTIDLACGNMPTFFLNLFRVGVFYGMTNEGVKRGMNIARKDNIEAQYQEVADELLKLQNIICTVSDFKEQKEAE